MSMNLCYAELNSQIKYKSENKSVYVKTKGVANMKDSFIRQGVEENDFDALMICAAEAIKSGEYLRARTMLKQSMTVDMENPEAYNLLGISYEKEGNRSKASRFYRVAYYMDQTFKSAADNLDRVCDFFYKGTDEIAWGLKQTGGKSK